MEKIKDIAIPFPSTDLQVPLVFRLRDHWKDSLQFQAIYQRKLAALDEAETVVAARGMLGKVIAEAA